MGVGKDKGEGMKYSPMIMGAESVWGILEGRKTMTRRVVTPQPTGDFEIGMYHPIGVDKGGEEYPKPERFGIWGDGWDIPCPYGQVGDRIWCKETWGIGCRPDPDSGWRDGIKYKADKTYLDGIESFPFRTIENQDLSRYERNGWNNPRFMPRLASRLTLEITGIRVERVQDITEDDAIAEGCNYKDVKYLNTSLYPPCFESVSITEYYKLWDSLNAKRGYPWHSDPWVWVIEFRRVEA
jgi:hypothetical protein